MVPAHEDKGLKIKETSEPLERILRELADVRRDQEAWKKEMNGRLDALAEEMRESLEGFEKLRRYVFEEQPVDAAGTSEIEVPVKAKKSRRSKLTLHELTVRRREIIRILERDSPEIIERVQNARNPAEAADAVLTPAVKEEPFRPGFLQDPHLCAEAIWKFVRSGRFHGSLRNLANAMAGVPEMSWKRSFDLCTANPPNPPIAMHHRAYRDFLHRNFPERLRELESAHTPDEVAKILAKSRSKDPIYLALRETPDKVLGWLKEGAVERKDRP
jgi:hypothetical protein